MTHALTLRLDDATYQKLRRQSYEQIRPISDLIREALMRPTDAEIRRDQAEKDAGIVRSSGAVGTPGARMIEDLINAQFIPSPETEQENTR